MSQAEFECFESRHVKKRFFEKSAVTRFCQRANEMFLRFSNMQRCEYVVAESAEIILTFGYMSVDVWIEHSRVDY